MNTHNANEPIVFGGARLQPCHGSVQRDGALAPEVSRALARTLPQRLKPLLLQVLTAWLRPCPSEGKSPAVVKTSPIMKSVQVHCT